MKHLFSISLVAALLLLTACGGGGSSSSNGLLIEGTLEEAGGASHSKSLFKHGVGQKIEEVAICALGECSTTDGEGQWGFEVDESNLGKAVLFSVNGHGIDTETVVELPASGKEIFLHLRHIEGGLIEIHHMEVDGVKVEADHDSEEHSHDEAGHSHE